MPFLPWTEHQKVESGSCLDCGMPIPKDALSIADGRARTYSHTYVTGEPVFCKNPKGRSEPCQKSTVK
jgi:hypothetical protein